MPIEIETKERNENAEHIKKSESNKRSDWKASFSNEPNIIGALKVLCDLCAFENKGRYEILFSVSHNAKEKET